MLRGALVQGSLHFGNRCPTRLLTLLSLLEEPANAPSALLLLLQETLSERSKAERMKDLLVARQGGKTPLTGPEKQPIKASASFDITPRKTGYSGACVSCVRLVQGPEA